MPRMRPGDAGRGTSSTREFIWRPSASASHDSSGPVETGRAVRSVSDPTVCVILTPMTSTPRTAGLLAALLLSAAAPASAATRIPGVRGPLPVTATSYPFGAADHTRVPANLEAIGYIEEEFLVAGTANVYD